MSESDSEVYLDPSDEDDSCVSDSETDSSMSMVGSSDSDWVSDEAGGSGSDKENCMPSEWEEDDETDGEPPTEDDYLVPQPDADGWVVLPPAAPVSPSLRGLSLGSPSPQPSVGSVGSASTAEPAEPAEPARARAPRPKEGKWQALRGLPTRAPAELAAKLAAHPPESELVDAPQAPLRPLYHGGETRPKLSWAKQDGTDVGFATWLNKMCLLVEEDGKWRRLVLTSGETVVVTACVGKEATEIGVFRRLEGRTVVCAGGRVSVGRLALWNRVA